MLQFETTVTGAKFRHNLLGIIRILYSQGPPNLVMRTRSTLRNDRINPKGVNQSYIVVRNELFDADPPVPFTSSTSNKILRYLQTFTNNFGTSYINLSRLRWSPQMGSYIEALPGSRARGPSSLGRIYHSEIHGTGRTSRRILQLHRWVHSRDACIHLSHCKYSATKARWRCRVKRPGKCSPSMTSHSGFCTRSSSG